MKSGKKALIGFLLIIGISCPLSIFLGIQMNSYQNTPVARAAWVLYKGDPQHEIVLAWETAEFTQAIVHFGLTEDSLSISVPEIFTSQFHNITLKNLLPNTQYFYSIEINGETYAHGQFRTAPSTYESFRFGMISDFQKKFQLDWFSRTASILQEKDYSFVVCVGDLIEDGTKAEWNDFFSRAAPFLSKFPIVPVRGNHDRPRDLNEDGIVEQYFNTYFPITEDKEIGKNKYDEYPQFFFSFNWSSVHFQVLNFPEVDIDDFSDNPDGLNIRDYYSCFTPDHLAWLEQDLKNAQALPFRISFFHCPITGAGFYGENFVLIEELLPILQKYNVTATAHGHAHHFERGSIQDSNNPNKNLTFFVVGTGGGLADVGLRPVKETQICASSPCYTEVEATADSMIFYTYSFGGDLIDQYRINAQGGLT